MTTSDLAPRAVHDAISSPIAQARGAGRCPNSTVAFKFQNQGSVLQASSGQAYV